MTDPKIWETSDLYLAAFLVAHEFDLQTTRREEGGRAYFVFFVDDDFQEVLDSWQTPKGYVIGHKYAHAVKDLKFVVHHIPGIKTK